jgi:hypothetical protein
MSKWDTFSTNKTNDSSTSSGVSARSRSLFAPADSVEQKGTSSDDVPIHDINSIDAAAKVTQKIQQNFTMCGRLPKQPVFKMPDGDEIEVEDGVMGAMGAAAAQLLDLAQTQELSSSLGLGSSGGREDEE